MGGTEVWKTKTCFSFGILKLFIWSSVQWSVACTEKDHYTHTGAKGLFIKLRGLPNMHLLLWVECRQQWEVLVSNLPLFHKGCRDLTTAALHAPTKCLQQIWSCALRCEHSQKAYNRTLPEPKNKDAMEQWLMWGEKRKSKPILSLLLLTLLSCLLPSGKILRIKAITRWKDNLIFSNTIRVEPGISRIQHWKAKCVHATNG